MTRQVIDLVAATRGLSPQYPKLSKLILQLRDSHSIRTDLSLANDFIGTMKVIGGEAGADPVAGIAENAFLALFYSALMLYVRATKTRHDNRRSFDFRGEYDPDQQTKHDVLCDLRDGALAHYGDGGRYTGPAFQKDGVFIPYGPGEDGKIMTASRRLVINPGLIADLDQMAHRALMLAEKRTQALNQRVTDEINQAAKDAPELLDLLRQHVMNFEEFLGSTDAVDEIMAGPRVGSRRGTARH